ncbi:MAG: cation:proton antiporter [Planctomycetaceae bacterium]
MHDLDLILTLTGALSAALACGALTHRLRLSPIAGYLLAGVIVGPYTPGFEADASLARQMAELGVVLLLFGVGLHFHLDDLLAVRGTVIPGATFTCAAATAAGALVGRALGWPWPAAFVFGGTLAVASTVVMLRVLADRRALHTRAGHLAVGWLVVEDLITVAALVVLPTIGGAGEAGPAALATALGTAIVKILLLVALVAFVGGTVVPRILDAVSDTGSRELFTLAVLVVMLATAVGAARVFGVSMALGAFLAGMAVGRSDYSLRAASEALPMRDAFAVLFFVSVGMLFDPAVLLREPLAILAAVAVVLVAKPAAALLLLRLRGTPTAVALPVAAALAQVGEFSFILADLGFEAGILPRRAVGILVATAIVTVTLAPIMYGAATRLAAGRAASDADGVGPADPAGRAPSHRAVVVGYGPVGECVTELLLDNRIDPTVVELNLETVRRLLAFGVRAVYGDAGRPEVLARAGVATADHLILSAAVGAAHEEIIRQARLLNPRVRILARAEHLRELPRLKRQGADDVFSGEGEVALAFTTTILGHLGATPEQIDRERARVEAAFRAG